MVAIVIFAFIYFVNVATMSVMSFWLSLFFLKMFRKPQSIDAFYVENHSLLLVKLKC